MVVVISWEFSVVVYIRKADSCIYIFLWLCDTVCAGEKLFRVAKVLSDLWFMDTQWGKSRATI